MNKLRLSTYTHTPSGTKSKDVTLLLLSLFILHYFSKAPKEGAAKQFRFAAPSFYALTATYSKYYPLFFCQSYPKNEKLADYRPTKGRCIYVILSIANRYII